MKLVKALSLNYRVNLLGVASALLLFYVASSDKPWWTLIGGFQNIQTFSAEVSPFNVVVEILSKPVTVPIIPYLTLAARLSVILAATFLLIGSLLANKSWAKPMINVRGITFPIIFILGLFIGLSVAESYVGVSLPLTGDFTLTYSIPYEELNIIAEIPASATLTTEYWVALIAGILSVLARIIHSRILRGAAIKPDTHPVGSA
ncbi:hypothetical protein H5T51_03310 [Candidatus Bathyarchaeota archaeon]|nr:hypothetical protein [Candidatus Bathyarchaeota archaeon]